MYFLFFGSFSIDIDKILYYGSSSELQFFSGVHVADILFPFQHIVYLIHCRMYHMYDYIYSATYSIVMIILILFKNDS